jgi:hypothetical protein
MDGEALRSESRLKQKNKKNIQLWNI